MLVIAGWRSTFTEKELSDLLNSLMICLFFSDLIRV